MIPLGGKCTLLAGDFRQCLPVSDIPAIENSSTLSLKYSDLWHHFNQMSLINNMRADADEVEFKEWSLRLGNGEEATIDNDSLIRLPDQVVCQQIIIHDTFGEGPIENAFDETPNSYPPHRLIMKVGAMIILLKNWSLKDGLCNGTRMRVTQLNQHSIKAAVLRGPNKDKEFSSIESPLDHQRIVVILFDW